MNPPPVLTDLAQERADRQHFDLLVAFHFVFSGFGVLGLGFLFLHYSLMNSVMMNPAWLRSAGHHEEIPANFFELFIGFYLVFAIVFLVGMLLNLLSAFFIRRRQHRFFSLVVAGVNCLQVPFGTALGVCTFIVLLRESVQRQYDRVPGSSSGGSP